jgi:hypothetical protein
MHWTLNKTFLSAAVVLVVGAVVLGFMEIGSPAKNRLIALDNRRVSDLYNIANVIVGAKNGPKGATTTLPVSMEEVKALSSYSVLATSDPSGAPYTYRVTGTSTFELCATFDIEQKADATQPGYAPADYTFWDHPAGNHCFSFSSGKYPPYYYSNNSYPIAPTPAPLL